jgi:hypothetical protein
MAIGGYWWFKYHTLMVAFSDYSIGVYYCLFYYKLLVVIFFMVIDGLFYWWLLMPIFGYNMLYYDHW